LPLQPCGAASTIQPQQLCTHAIGGRAPWRPQHVQLTHVRYTWADAPCVNLYSTEDLPAAPFELEIK
jgi:hypothetical protein